MLRRGVRLRERRVEKFIQKEPGEQLQRILKEHGEKQQLRVIILMDMSHKLLCVLDIPNLVNRVLIQKYGNINILKKWRSAVPVNIFLQAGSKSF